MRYLGGKTRFADELSQIFVDTSKKYGINTYIEPMVGAASVIKAVRDRIPTRIGSDVNEYLIEMHKALQDDWEPPFQITEDEWYDIKNNKDNHPPELVAFAGFACSWGGKWFGGYARGGGRNTAHEAYFNLMDFDDSFREIDFRCCDYTIYEQEAVYYFDPPYEGTTAYGIAKNFNSQWFWKHVTELSQRYPVFVSEYNAPDGWAPIWETKTTCLISNGVDAERTERLFFYKGK